MSSSINLSSACLHFRNFSSSIEVNDETNECAWVPLTGMPNNLPARTLLVPSKPPIKQYLEAVRPPSGPWARRRPNSRRVFFSPAAIRNLAAFVHTRLVNRKNVIR